MKKNEIKCLNCNNFFIPNPKGKRQFFCERKCYEKWRERQEKRLKYKEEYYSKKKKRKIVWQPVMGAIKKSLEYAKSIKENPDRVRLWEVYLSSLNNRSNVSNINKKERRNAETYLQTAKTVRKAKRI